MEERFELYYQLIQQLLTCPEGEKLELLEANSDLVDLGLLFAMQQVANYFAENDNSNAAERLRSFAQRLVEQMGFNSADEMYRDYLNCLIEILQAIAKNSSAEVIYPLLRSNLEKLNLNLGFALDIWAKETLSTVESEQAQVIALAIFNFGSLIGQFPLGNKADNLELAIMANQITLMIYTQQDFPVDWALTQNNLGNAYRERIREERAENLEKAIASYENALIIYTQQDFPVQWAMTQNNLGVAYRERIREERAENLEKAIASYENALIILTQQDFPVDWALTQNNLGNAYRERIREERAENLEKAIASYENALIIYTQQDFPVQWAMTQNNLGVAYRERIREERAENLEKAIASYENALIILTQQDFPVQWALTQNNLGNAYRERIREERAENLEKAIASYENALIILTQFDFPVDCLRTARNLGELHFDQGNWELAIQAYQKAIAAIEITRNWATNDLRRQEILANSMDVYEKTIQACINNGQVDLAIEITERSRARHLVDLMASNDLYQGGDIPEQVQAYLEQYEHLQERINLLRSSSQASDDRTLATSGTRWRNREVLSAENEEINQLEAEKQQIWQQIRRLDPILAGQQQVDPISFTQIQQLIDNKSTAILCFYSTWQDTYIFILYRDRESQVHTCNEQNIGTLYNEFLGNNWLRPYRQDFGKWRENMPKALEELAERLKLDRLIEQYLQGIEELIIIPHILLHQIPFAALPVNSISPTPSESYGVHTSPDRLQNTESSPPSPPSLGGTRFQSPPEIPPELGVTGAGDLGGKNLRDETQETYVDTVASEREIDTRGMGGGKRPSKPFIPEDRQYLGDLFRLRILPSCQILNYCHQRPSSNEQSTMGIVENASGDLPYTVYECETIANQYGVEPSKRLQQNRATIAEYRKIASQVTNLHSSHHGSANPNNPLESALILSDANLTLGELLTPGWRKDLQNLSDVYLNNCETNFSVNKINDDLLSMATGFLCAGARSVVSTLWSVDDCASALLAIFYYEEFRNSGSSRPQALQKAQQKLRTLTGTQLQVDYLEQLESHLARQYQQELANSKATQNLKESEKYKQRANKIQRQIEHTLPEHCKSSYPFADPFYWAGFISQGLA